MLKDKKEEIEPTEAETVLTGEHFVDQRMKFVQNYPFYGILLLELKAMATGPEIPVAAVNYKSLFLNAIDPKRLGLDEKGKPIEGFPFWSLSDLGKKTVMAHEILHLVFEHLTVPRSFNKDVANIAMDAVINRILSNDSSFSLSALPPGVVTPVKEGGQYVGFSVGVQPMKTYKIVDYENKDWLPIYWDIMDQLEKEAGGSNRSDIAEAIKSLAKKLGQSNPMQGDTQGQEEENTTADFEQQVAKFRQKVVSAAESCEKTQGTVPGEVSRMIGELVEGKVHWTQHLRRLMKTEIAKDDFSHKSNSRRAHLGGRGRPCVFPKVESETIGDVYLALDTSGSMSPKDILDGLSEFASMRQCMPFRLHFMSCDAQAYDVKTYERFEEPDWLAMPIKGGGGTDFRPVFKRIEEMRDNNPSKPALLVYFTDGFGSFDTESPEYPVIWICNYPKSDGRFPWGQVISTVD